MIFNSSMLSWHKNSDFAFLKGFVFKFNKTKVVTEYEQYFRSVSISLGGYFVHEV